jgi:hypothetical protein
VRDTPLDASAATIRVVPPRGANVMIYRNNKVEGWFVAPGVTTVQPGEVYGIVATRGTNVLFNAGLLLRPGWTDVVWNKGTLPTIGYQPSFVAGPGAHAYADARRPRPASGTQATTVPRSTTVDKAAQVPKSARLRKAQLRRLSAARALLKRAPARRAPGQQPAARPVGSAKAPSNTGLHKGRLARLISGR